MQKLLPVLLTAVMIVLGVSNTRAQYFDCGISAGISRYYGDLTPSTGDMEIHPSFGFLLRENITPNWSARFSFVYGGMSGKDANSQDPVQRLRNLSFKSDFYEFGFTGEYNFLSFIPEEGKHPFTPYLFGGAAFMNFNPKGLINGKWYDLRELSTEGQGLNAYPSKEQYSSLQIAFPLGFGLRYSLNPKATVGFEIGYRFTTTDYLDDVGGTYADPNVIRASRGDIAAALSNRSNEVYPTDISRYVGQNRANPDGHKDAYLVVQVYFTTSFYDAFPFQPREAKRKVKKKSEPGEWF